MVQNAAEMNLVVKLHDLEVRDLSAAGAMYTNILSHGVSTREVLDVQFAQYTTPTVDGYGSSVTVTMGSGAEIIFLQRWVGQNCTTVHHHEPGLERTLPGCTAPLPLPERIR